MVSEKDRESTIDEQGDRPCTGEDHRLVNSDDWYEPEPWSSSRPFVREHGDAVYYGILRVMEDGRK